MQCLQCRYENASNAKFCNQCAAPFAPVCSACGHGNTADAKFCNQCGTSLTAPTAERASQRSANVEAIHALDQALTQLAQLPPGETRDKRELALQVMKLGPLIPVKGYASPAIDETSARALALCRSVGDNAMLFPTLYARWVGLAGHESHLSFPEFGVVRKNRCGVDARFRSEQLLVCEHPCRTPTRFKRK